MSDFALHIHHDKPGAEFAGTKKITQKDHRGIKGWRKRGIGAGIAKAGVQFLLMLSLSVKMKVVPNSNNRERVRERTR
ncbi:hypothetical protein KIH86_10210 [Paenibacillus sp. HN-1]|uniref:hypothetical protein n=1 Tax=Paenibacillus TaxID=44249 RepID=UPI001CA93484|nr:MULTISPECIES: hypothetical protein [Paenibacillus]MBY9079962.1 hypothetical protein [Paenibacillus sp. CGMCC 1.18879]MBY9084604.1 hypothetical protein [Paenibacillus sinensis]